MPANNPAPAPGVRCFGREWCAVQCGDMRHSSPASQIPASPSGPGIAPARTLGLFYRPGRPQDASARRRRPDLRTLSAAAALALAIPGCGGISLPGRSGSGSIVSDVQPTELRPRLSTQVYERLQTDNEADIYLTDLDPAVLNDPDALASATGHIVHLHMFLRPKAGRTPIEASAVTLTVRYTILADGVAGTYAGAGFVFPRGKPGEDRFAGRVVDATLRLAVATPGFVDRLGVATLRMPFSARLDPTVAGQARELLDTIALASQPVVDPTPLVRRADPDAEAADALPGSEIIDVQVEVPEPAPEPNTALPAQPPQEPEGAALPPER